MAKKGRPGKSARRKKRPSAARIGLVVVLALAALGVAAKLLGLGGGGASPWEDPEGRLVVMEFFDFG